MTFPFAKGHGTRNDFVILPDLDGVLHGDLNPALVRDLCDRRSGIGADGVLRVLRGDVDGEPGYVMDYRNADGSLSEMCGNGLRVFARYLADSGLVDPTRPLRVGTRDGAKQVAFCADGEISVDMGTPTVGAQVTIEVAGRARRALSVSLGNPHAVVTVDALGEAGDLSRAPGHDEAEFPDGVNVEFVERRGAYQLGMRVFERGVGETQSCGTGACAAVVAASADAGEARSGATYVVDVLGGRVTVTWDETDHVSLKGPAVVVAEGHWLDARRAAAAAGGLDRR